VVDANHQHEDELELFFPCRKWYFFA